MLVLPLSFILLSMSLISVMTFGQSKGKRASVVHKREGAFISVHVKCTGKNLSNMEITISVHVNGIKRLKQMNHNFVKNKSWCCSVAS